MRINSWTEEEDNIIISFYPSEGKKASERLPRRSEAAVIMRAKHLGVKWDRHREYSLWTEDENRILKEYYPAEGSGVIKRLPGRTGPAVIFHARELGISCGNRSAWSPEEDQLLRDHYPTEGAGSASRLPGRTVNAVKRRAFVLKITEENCRWTPEEDKLMEKFYRAEGKKILKRLPGKSERIIKRRAKKLGLSAEWRVWTEDEDDRIRTYYPTFFILYNKCQLTI